MWKNWIIAFKVKVTTRLKNVSECLSRWYLLNHRIFCYQTWSSDAGSWARVLCGKKLFAIIEVKVTATAHNQNVTLSTTSSELLILRQPNLVWWYITINQSVLWKKWVTALSIKVTAKSQNVNFFQMICSKPPNILLPNLVLWCIIMSWSVVQKDWLAIVLSRSRSQQGLMWSRYNSV